MKAVTLAICAVVVLCSGACGENSDDHDDNVSDTSSQVEDTDNMTITVTPKNDESDFEALQSAVDNIAPGGTVKLSAGTFYLGDGQRSPKKTVRITKGMTIQGEMDGQDWTTVVDGGGEVAPWGFFGFEMETGPFRVENFDDEHAVVFENIQFSNWTAHAVYIEASHGFAIKQCKLDTPRLGTAVMGIRSVHAVFSSGQYAKGAFLAEDNLVQLDGYSGDVLPDDEQFIGLFFSSHDNITIVDNEITGHDEGIEVLGNNVDLSQMEYFAEYSKPDEAPYEITISGNTIDVTQILDDTVWPGKYGILVGGNANTSKVLIENNDVTIRGTEKGYVFALSGENLHVVGNQLRLDPLEDVNPGGALLIGFGYSFHPLIPELNGGPSLIDSLIEENMFTGVATGPSVYFHDIDGTYKDHAALFPIQESNLSHGNQIEMNGIVGLGAATTLAISPGAYDNEFIGDTGNVLDLSPPNANQY